MRVGEEVSRWVHYPEVSCSNQLPATKIMKTKIILTEDQYDLIRMGTVICSRGEQYCYLPYWFKLDDGKSHLEVELISPEKLPNHIVDFIISERNIPHE